MLCWREGMADLVEVAAQDGVGCVPGALAEDALVGELGEGARAPIPFGWPDGAKWEMKL